jgi:hypothetical protein
MGGYVLPEEPKRLTPRDLHLYFESMAKPCHGKCQAGWYHIAFQDNGDGTYDIYRFPCKCTFPGGLYYFELTQPFRYNRKPDYVATWGSGKILMHPRNLDKMWGPLKKLIANRVSINPDDEIPF